MSSDFYIIRQKNQQLTALHYTTRLFGALRHTFCTSQ